MKLLPVLVALMAVGASGFAVTPKSMPDRTKTIPPAEPIAISIDDLALPIKSRSDFQESLIPERIRELDGRQVRLIGQMNRPFLGHVIREFVFNGDTEQKTNYNCYDDSWSAIPLQHMIKVQMKEGTTINPTTLTIEVIGRLQIEVERSEKEILFIYKIEDATIRQGEREEGFQPSLPMTYYPDPKLFDC